MRSARGKRQARRVAGIVPFLGRMLWAAIRWVGTHPQPVVVWAVLLAAPWAYWTYAREAPVFRVERVVLPPQTALKLRQPLVGDNIWQVDLQAVSEDLKRQQPWLKTVRVTRHLPDAIRVDAIPRRPVAQVKADRWYPVDREGYVLPDGSPGPADHLVRLSGVGAVTVGKDNEDKKLALALRVAAIARRTPGGVGRHIAEVSVANPEQIRLLMDDETEVRCGSEEELQAQLGRLQATLRAVAKQALAVQYIDVRFREPVVAPRT